MARENYPKHITQPFEYAFSVGDSGLYALTIAASCKSGTQTGRPSGEDLKVEIDGLRFREIPAVARVQTYDIPAAWNGSQLRGLKKTILFILKLTAGNHTIKFIPDRGATIEAEPTIAALPDSRNITLNLENQAEYDDRRPWVTVVLVDLPLQSFSADVTAQWHLIDSDDVKLIVDSQIKRNPESLFRRHWFWAGSILKKLQQSERQTPIFKENLRQGVHYIEFWADRTPTLHTVTLDVGEITLPEEPEPPGKRVPSVDDPKWTGDFDDDPDEILFARLRFGEAEGESREAKIWVGASILNRVQAQTWWGKTLREVILKPGQYDPFKKDNPVYKKIINPLKNADPGQIQAWRESHEVASGLLSDEIAIPTEATHFHGIRVTRDWFVKHVVPHGRFLRQIDNTHFYWSPN